MIHGYHIILPFYGFWLPNDPRGSWSDFVWKWELARFGRAAKDLGRRTFDQLTPHEIQQQTDARAVLNYSPVSLTGTQALSVAKGFAFRVLRSSYTVWACAILPEHVHVVLARHTYPVEQMAKLLKASATYHLRHEKQHPFQPDSPDTKPLRSVWAESQWKVYLNNEEHIETAIRYVEENPGREGKPCQTWSFVTPFRGLQYGHGHVTYH